MWWRCRVARGGALAVWGGNYGTPHAFVCARSVEPLRAPCKAKAVIFFSRGAFGPLCADGTGVICAVSTRAFKPCYITLLEDNSARQPLRRDYTAHTPASFAPGPGSLSSRSGTRAPRRPARNHRTQTTLCIPHPSSTEDGICAILDRGRVMNTGKRAKRHRALELHRSLSDLTLTRTAYARSDTRKDLSDLRKF